jgi:acylphosphatase
MVALEGSMSEQLKSSRAHVTITGRVQGVSFRWYTQRTAQELGLTGWVRNLWDGRVEAIFEGEEKAVKDAVAWCYHGPPSAQVDDIEIKYESPSGEFKGFRITW